MHQHCHNFYFHHILKKNHQEDGLLYLLQVQDFPEGAEITEQLGHVADMLDNPVLEGVAAELLPGTKFLKPGKDLIDGDYGKAA